MTSLIQNISCIFRIGFCNRLEAYFYVNTSSFRWNIYLVTPNASIIQRFNRFPRVKVVRVTTWAPLPVQPRRGESGGDELIWQATCNCENNVDLRLESRQKKTRLSSLSSDPSLSLQLYANDQANEKAIVNDTKRTSWSRAVFEQAQTNPFINFNRIST